MKVKFIIIVILILMVGCNKVANTQMTNPNSKGRYENVKKYMRSYIKEQMKDNDITGLSIALTDGKKIVWQEGFGYANKDKGIKATPQTIYRAGSITKLFTDMSVMKLAELGKIDIDKPFKKYLPEFKIKSRFGSTDNITPRNIMTHHSAIPSDWLEGVFTSNPMPFTNYVKVIKNEYVTNKPNTVFSYSNLAITLLGHSVQRVSGIKYAKFVEQNFLKPMDMNNSNINAAIVGNNISKSYKKGKEVIEYANSMVPAGGLNTSVKELSHFAIMLNSNGKYKNHQLLKPRTIKKMFRVQNTNVALDVGNKIGLGFAIDDTTLGRDNRIYCHGGAMVAHRAYFGVSPRTKLGVVVMANSANANPLKIGEELFKKAYEAKTGKKPSKKRLVVNYNSNFEGIYSTIIGAIKIEKSGNDSYNVKSNKGEFKLYKTNRNSYKLKYKLFGFLPISNSKLDELELYTKDINGYHIIIASFPDIDILAGVKVDKPTNIPTKWKEYLGEYKPINNLEAEDFKIDYVELKIKDGYLVADVNFKLGELDTTLILKAINDTEVIIEGLGRNRGNTLYFKGGIFHAMGLKLVKVQ